MLEDPSLELAQFVAGLETDVAELPVCVLVGVQRIGLPS